MLIFRYLLIVYSFFILFSCKNKKEILQGNLLWKYCGGAYKEEDIISFKTNKWKYNKDTIFLNEFPTATCVLNSRIDGSYQLILINIKTKDSTFYCGK